MPGLPNLPSAATARDTLILLLTIALMVLSVHAMTHG
jgi:hypothetical protein